MTWSASFLLNRSSRARGNPALSRLHLESLNRELKLTCLRSTRGRVEPIVDLSIILTLCPRVHEVNLANTGLTNEDLYTLMQLDTITSLSISAEREPQWDFHEGLAPLLQVKGHQMESLIVTDFLLVDVTGRSERLFVTGVKTFCFASSSLKFPQIAEVEQLKTWCSRLVIADAMEEIAFIVIGRWCPNLKNLAFSGNQEYKPVPNGILGSQFPNLIALEMWCSCDTLLSESTLKHLLLNAKSLRNLLVKGCDVFTNEFMLEIWKANATPELAHFTVHACPITGGLLTELMEKSLPNLDTIRIWNCDGVTHEDYRHLKDRAERENMEMYLEWYR
ncbi:unnamed protein product [Darwinula stevensoni]|uniref:Uncharacterized protein n=1 Tax=Darwinula stevensoni TaxID=69355 RepID=A0A7R9A5A3_9CRUS|nr:unnamed protein product [Darwinula stevensoni]CAG0891672.1 unnamed protein product [Darwinula stevensoni]